MSRVWDTQVLLLPISADQPCGESLEDTQVLAALDAFRLFGQPSSPESFDPENPRKPPDWTDVRATSLEALTKSKDLRVLAHLATALLRTDGFPAYAAMLDVAAQWLDAYWPTVYPALDEGDSVFRRNALNCFADPMAVVDRVRRLPLANSRQHGRFSLRDLEISAGQLAPGKDDPTPDEAQIRAAFEATPPEELSVLYESVVAAGSALRAIDAKMRAEGGSEAAPTFDALLPQLARVRQTLAVHTATAEEEGGDVGQAPGGAVVGAIRTRTEALRALDAVAEFFRQTEPSSPVPMLVARAKRLIDKDFLEILADLAPDALDKAREVAGLKTAE